MSRSLAARSMSAIASSARHRSSSCQPTISRVAAVDRGHQVAPGRALHPDRGQVEVPELVGALDPEEAWASAPGLAPPALDQAVLAHHAQDALAIHGSPELAANERPDHAIAVGRVLVRDLDDRLHLCRHEAGVFAAPASASACGRSPGG